MSIKALIDRVAEQTGHNKKEIKRILEATASSAADLLRSTGEPVTLPNIGKIKLIDKPERMGKRPGSNEEVLLPASRKVRLTPIKALKTAVLGEQA